MTDPTNPGAAGNSAPSGSAPSNLNLPNALTTMRIALVPVYGWFLLGHDHDSVLWRSLAWVIFAIAMITDKIDGDIARSRGLITDFGKIADPIADKALTGMAFVALSITGDIWWWVTILVLTREWSVTLLRLSVAKHVVMAANQSGKLKTTLQALALGGITLPGRQLAGWADVPGDIFYLTAQVLLVAAVAMTLYSGYEFFRDFWQQRRRTPTP
ncbi:CDP-diacylglycerol--glycerol-3-phosphate 3-phosphatidyltransferase [Nocardioides sp. R-C-SC26]|uniref:CDP-diacylglycerol--glycerol-3-phosphate 3-phosphatidyltransferase n=1 Tax=Nocardioides sp. R-C-SC26 TaxID=2870414 RepID=UPI001E3AEA9B|nr:CDP-diacylglycerol--glycerol-3-phosphate 3-phosphatidyltransferase [Nocardioides sp. R-C-SC26]